MFRIRNLQNGDSQDFKNRAALLLGLEGEDHRYLQLNQQTTFQVFQLDKQESLLDSIEINLPSADGRDINSLLGEFGFKKEGKAFFGRKNNTPKSSEPSSQKETPQTQSNPQTQPTTSSKPTVSTSSGGGFGSFLKNLILGVALVLSGTSLYISLQSSHPVKVVKEEPSQSQVVDHSADIFCRYFISSYFSQSDSLTDYLSKKLDKVNAPQASPVSVLLEKEKQSHKTLVLTYVINARYEDDTYQTKRLTLTLKANSEAKHGYLVTKEPRLTAYP